MPIHRVVAQYFNCGFHSKVSADELFNYAKMNKKIIDDKLNLILLAEPGKLAIKSTKIDYQLKKIVEDYLNSNPILYFSPQYNLRDVAHE